MSLTQYRKKRDFSKTKEPDGKKVSTARKKLIFVVQKHAASHLHYDFRLEHEGALLSWAVPKGPSLDPKVKRLAMHVEDHPIEYAKFEGSIPEGEYGAGSVIVWDRGHWKQTDESDLKGGKLKFELQGKKLKGLWTLIKLKGGPYGGKDSWLLIKERDKFADPETDITEAAPLSVKSGKTLEELIEKRSRKLRKAEK